MEIRVFFQNPFGVFEAEIDQLYEDGNYKIYCVLALCVMFNDNLNEKWLTGHEVDKGILHVIKNTCEACRLNRGKSRLELKDELESLLDTLVRIKDGIYKIVHDKLFDF